MGEYAKRKSDGQEIKIGTRESMYYLRYEDRKKVTPISSSLDASTQENLFWRLPFPDEDDVLMGEYEECNRGLRLYRKDLDLGCVVNFSDPETIDHPGIMQFSHQSGLLLNVKCYHGEKLPEKSKDVDPFWNGKSWSLELVFVKNTKDGLFPIVRCRHCGKIWRYSWENILPFVNGEIKRRLEKYI